MKDRTKTSGASLPVIALLLLMVAPGPMGDAKATDRQAIKDEINLHIAIAAGMVDDIQLGLDCTEDAQMLEIIRHITAWRTSLKKDFSEMLERFPQDGILKSLVIDNGEVLIGGLAPTNPSISDALRHYQASPRLERLQLKGKERVRYQDTTMLDFTIAGNTRQPFPELAKLPKNRSSAQIRAHHPRPNLLSEQQLEERLVELQSLITAGLDARARHDELSQQARQMDQRIRSELQAFNVKASSHRLLEVMVATAHSLRLRVLDRGIMRAQRWQRVWVLPIEIQVGGPVEGVMNYLDSIRDMSPVMIISQLSASHRVTDEVVRELTVHIKAIAIWADQDSISG